MPTTEQPAYRSVGEDIRDEIIQDMFAHLANMKQTIKILSQEKKNTARLWVEYECAKYAAIKLKVSGYGDHHRYYTEVFFESHAEFYRICEENDYFGVH